MRNRILTIIFTILLITSNKLFVSGIVEQSLLSTEEWKKKWIEDTGCPYVSQDQMLVKNVCLMPYYQLNESPHKNNFEEYVTVNLQAAKVLEIDESNNKLTIQLSQHLHWYDHRIKANFSEEFEDVGLIKLTPNNFFQIWHPDLDLFTINLLEWESLYKPKLYKDIVIQYHRWEDGEYSEMIAWKEWKATIVCDFEFKNFPFDTQTCRFVQKIDSNSLTHIEYFSNMTKMEYTAVGFEIEILLKEETTQNETDEFIIVEIVDEIGFNITLKRIVNPYLYQCYLPCAAIVTVSQVSFMIPQESVPGRISLIATQFLTLTNIFIYQLSHSPSGTQLNALEIYILTSLFFVLATIIEFGVVLALKRANFLGRQQSKDMAFKRSQNAIAPMAINKTREKQLTSNPLGSLNLRKFGEKQYTIADKIDFASFVLFTFAYILFNVVYMIQYSN